MTLYISRVSENRHLSHWWCRSDPHSKHFHSQLIASSAKTMIFDSAWDTNLGYSNWENICKMYSGEFIIYLIFFLSHKILFMSTLSYAWLYKTNRWNYWLLLQTLINSRFDWTRMKTLQFKSRLHEANESKFIKMRLLAAILFWELRENEDRN